MTCRPIYDEMMSVKLDGLLGSDEEHELQAHINDCADCSLTWSAMTEADAMLCATAKAPVPVPATLHASVMLKISQVQVYRPQMVTSDRQVEQPVMVPALGSILPESPNPVLVGAYGPTLEETWQEWQQRLSRYLRGAAAVGLSVAGTAGLVIALMLSGVIKLDGPFSGFVGTLRTFFAAVNTWVGSLFADVGTGTVAGIGLVMGVMVLVAWQLVSAYQRTLELEQGNIPAGQMVEAAA